MSNFNSNLEYDIISDAEVTNILSHFDTDEILNFVDDNLSRKHMFYPNNPLNYVGSLETNFSFVYMNLPSEKEKIDEIRDDVYKAIINKICTYFNLEFNDNGQDYYTIAYYLYEFFITQFSNNVIKAFTNYIIKEKDYLYNYVGLMDLKKNKDISTTYSKKIHKDSKIAIINANLEYVIDSISLFDIPFEDLLSLSGLDKNVIELFSVTISPRGDIFKDHFRTTINNEYKAIFLTNMKFALLDYDGVNIGQNTMNFLQQA